MVNLGIFTVTLRGFQILSLGVVGWWDQLFATESGSAPVGSAGGSSYERAKNSCIVLIL